MHQTPTYSYCPAHFIQNSLEKIISRRRCRHLWPPNTYTNNQQPERKRTPSKTYPNTQERIDFSPNEIDNTRLVARKPKTGVSRGISDESYEENDTLPGRRGPRTTIQQQTITILTIKQQNIYIVDTHYQNHHCLLNNLTWHYYQHPTDITQFMLTYNNHCNKY